MITTRQIKIIFKDRKLFVSIILVIVGLIFLGHYLLKDKVNSKSDLVDITTKLRDFSFDEYKGYRNHTYSYYLYLDGYRNNFQIIADFVDYFNKDYFERTIKVGDSIRIFISRNDFVNIQNYEKIKVFGIYSKNSVYLDCDNSIYQYNSGLTLYGGLLFVAVGLILFYTNKDKLIEKK